MFTLEFFWETILWLECTYKDKLSSCETMSHFAIYLITITTAFIKANIMIKETH